MDPMLRELTAQAATILMQNTASIVAGKVQGIKAKKNDKEAVAELTELINDLVEKNAQLQSLAQAYKQELIAQQINEGDIEYITKTLIPLVEGLMGAGDVPVSQKTLNVVKKLLSKETLNVMQLLGFNFKQAIGLPLTRLLSDYISSRSSSTNQEDMQRDALSLQLKMMDLAQDPDSYERYIRLMGNEVKSEAK